MKVAKAYEAKSITKSLRIFTSRDLKEAQMEIHVFEAFISRYR